MLFVMDDMLRVATRMDDPHMEKLRPYRNRRRAWPVRRWWRNDG